MANNQEPPKGKPKLTLIKNLNVGDVSMNVNARGDIKLSTNAEKIIINNRRPRNKPTPLEGVITPGHKADLHVLVKAWLNLAVIRYPLRSQKSLNGEIWKKLNGQAKSAGRNGVSSINEYPDCDFERGKKFLEQQIAILNGNATVRKKSPDWSKQRIGHIQARCKKLGIPDEIRKKYQKERFGKDSLADFNREQLEEMYQYVQQDSPSFDTKRVNAKNTQQQRENELDVLLRTLRVKNAWFSIPEPLPFDKAEMRRMLEDQAPRLFEGLSDSAFNGFWNKQKLCSLKRGNKPKS